MINKMIKTILFSLFGNRIMQNFLEKIVFFCNYFMGIGSGSTVSSSGENVVFSLIKSGSPIIFDVGANQGQFAKEALKCSNGIVYSFEPSRKTFKILEENINNKRHKAFNIGLGKKNEEMELYYDSVGSGLASLTKRDLGVFNINFDKSEKVQIVTIDNFCKEHNILKIDLLKIDVEGHELDVLTGSQNMLEHIENVMFEFGGCNIDTKTYFKDFYTFFKEKNMKLYRITPSGYLHQLGAYKEIFEQFRTTNFVARRDNV